MTEMESQFSRLEDKLDRVLGYLESLKEQEPQSESKNLEIADNRQWLTTQECCQQLGVTRVKLYGLRSSARFGKCGQAWRYSNVSRFAKRPTYQWHLSKCQELLQKSLGQK